MRDYSAENGNRWIPLPGTKKEIEDTARFFDGKKLILLEKEVTKDRIKKEIGYYSIIHFAAHGLLDDRKPMWSVEDESTSELFIDFYKNLKSMTYCEALRAAKLSMIEKSAHRSTGRPSST